MGITDTEYHCTDIIEFHHQGWADCKRHRKWTFQAEMTPLPHHLKFKSITLTVRAFWKLWEIQLLGEIPLFVKKFNFSLQNHQTIGLIWKFYPDGWREHKRHRKWTFQRETKTPWKSEPVTLKNKKVRAFWKFEKIPKKIPNRFFFTNLIIW